MKKIYLLSLFQTLLYACGGGATDIVNLSGEIKGLGDDTLYIYGTDRFYDRMDTIVVRGGKFSVALSTDTLVATWLLFGDGTRYPLYMDKGDKIEVKGTVGMPYLEVSGNEPNRQLTAYLKEMEELDNPSPKVLEEKAELFIGSHPSSLVSIYLIEKYFVQQPRPDLKRVKELIERLTGELKDRPYIEELLAYIQREEKVEVGKVAPTFRLKNAEGKEISRTDFKDKYLLLHFWASWDTLSRAQNVLYRRIYKLEQQKQKEDKVGERRRVTTEKERNRKNGQLALLGISIDLDKGQWCDAVCCDTLQWEQVCDPAGWNAAIIGLFAINELPANLLLSPSGRIEGRNLDEEELKRLLERIHN